jgi:type I restriction enzyme S subunit
MLWVAPSEKDTDNAALGKRLWDFEPIHMVLAALTKQIQNLRRTRDLLLPRLLSGQVELKAEEAIA